VAENLKNIATIKDCKEMAGNTGHGLI